jgi:hypothetical protein
MTGSVAAMFALACSDPPPPPEGPRKCAGDEDCASGQLCHPIGRVCVPTCNAAGDCPKNQANCAAIKDAKGKDTTAKICGCTSTAACRGDDKESTLVCSALDNICEPGCKSDGDCAHFEDRRCETPLATCVFNEAVRCTKDEDCKEPANPRCDMGTGKCVPPPKCTGNADCLDPAKPLCNGATGACEAKCVKDGDCKDPTRPSCVVSTGVCGPKPKCDPAKPLGANGGPDFCKYGEFCDSKTGGCAAAKGTCEAAVKYVPAGNSRSPIVWGVTASAQTRQATDGICAGKVITKLEGRFYDRDGDVTSVAAYERISYITKEGQNPTNTGNTYEKTFISAGADGKTGTFSFELCENLKGKAQGVTMLDSASNESNVACFVF